jgi:hypothetical protein
VYSRKAIEAALEFAVLNPSEHDLRWGLDCINFRADGSIRATDGHMLIVVPPVAIPALEPPGIHRRDAIVPARIIAKFLDQTRLHKLTHLEWFGIGDGETYLPLRLAHSADGKLTISEPFEAGSNFPSIKKLMAEKQHEGVTFALSATLLRRLTEAVNKTGDKLTEAVNKTGDKLVDSTIVFEFHGPEEPIDWRSGGAFGSIMPIRLSMIEVVYSTEVFETSDYEKSMREVPDK